MAMWLCHCQKLLDHWYKMRQANSVIVPYLMWAYHHTTAHLLCLAIISPTLFSPANCKISSSRVKTSLETLFDCFSGCTSTCYETNYRTRRGRIDKILKLRVSGYQPIPSLLVEVKPTSLHVLSKVVKHLLCIPATSVPTDRVFGTAWDVVTAQRAYLLHENVDMLGCVCVCFLFFKEC